MLKIPSEAAWEFLQKASCVCCVLCRREGFPRVFLETPLMSDTLGNRRFPVTLPRFPAQPPLSPPTPWSHKGEGAERRARHCPSPEAPVGADFGRGKREEETSAPLGAQALRRPRPGPAFRSHFGEARWNCFSSRSYPSPQIYFKMELAEASEMMDETKT